MTEDTGIFTIGPTDGLQTIAKAAGVFTLFIQDTFESFGTDVRSEPTGPQNVRFHKINTPGTLEEAYCSLGIELDSLCLTQPQIIQFVSKYPEQIRASDHGTFFLFKVGDEFFVTEIHFDNACNGFAAFTDLFIEGEEFDSGIRLVLPCE